MGRSSAGYTEIWQTLFISIMASTSHRSPASDLRDQPLPPEVSVRSDTWLSRARNYPVFSRTWLYYRMLAWSVPVALILLLGLLVTLALGGSLPKVFQVALPIAFGLSALHLLGPALAVVLRQRRYRERLEGWLLVLVLLFGAACAWATFQGVNYGLKHLLRNPDSRVVLNASAGVSNDDDTDRQAERPVERPAAQPASAGRLPASGATAAASQPATGAQSAAQSSARSGVTASQAEAGFDQQLAITISNIFNNTVLLCGALYLGGAYDLWLYFRQKKRLQEVLQQRELEQALDARREAELRLSVLAAQVEPHFLFNTLAGVRSAIQTEPQRASAIIDHLVDYLRASIPEFRHDARSTQASLRKQLAAAHAYLSLMRARIPRLSFEVSSNIEEAAIPPLMLISLVENAIKHGVEPKVGAAHIRVSAVATVGEAGQPRLELSVEDDGVGFGGSSSGSGIGLSNIHARLASMYGEQAGLLLKSRPEGGVIATIWLPLEIA